MDHGHDHQHGSSCEGHSHGHSEHSEHSENNAHDHSDSNSSSNSNSNSQVRKRDGTDANDYSRFENVPDSDDESPEDAASKEDQKVEVCNRRQLDNITANECALFLQTHIILV